MLSQQLPKFINPIRLAEKHTTLKGILSLADMPRLREFLADTTGEVSVILNFNWDENHSVFIHLKANTALMLQCQRCMESFSFPLLIDILFHPVTDEIEASQRENYEPFLMKDELIAVQDMVEDEILLNLPLVAKHAQNVCPVVLSTSNENPVESPFKELSKLKK